MDGKKRGAEGTWEKGASTKPRTESDISSGESHVRQESHEGGNNSKRINVRIDPDVLDCSICRRPLRPPLFQCSNGHVAYSSCCAELQNKCHVCSLPTGNSRCRSLETVIEAIKIPCPHSKFGCPEIIPYTQKDTHEEFCPFAPCTCPVSSCTFQGPTERLWVHIMLDHPTTSLSLFFYNHPFKVALQQEEPVHVLRAVVDKCIFLLLNSSNVPYGSSLSIACIRPQLVESDLVYEIKVKGKGSELHLKASPKNFRELKVASPAKGFLFVPSEICDSAGVISIDVCIKKL